MKGFVPVTKESLAIMLGDCLKVIATDYATQVDAHIQRIVSKEIERTKTRRWYRFWTLPKRRFTYDKESVIKWSGEIDYPMFDGCPFKALKTDEKRSIAWVNRLARVASNNHAGEPIQLDMGTFQRISEPDRYIWVSTSWYASVRD